MTEAQYAANRRNANMPGTGRPKGSMNADKLELSSRCRVNDEKHIKILEQIAEFSSNEGYRMTAIRDLMDRGHGRPRQAIDAAGSVTLVVNTGVETHPNFGSWDDEGPLTISPPKE
jgi:hypothetical protein